MGDLRDKNLSHLVLPDGVGPHEGRELELLLSGSKPMAMFYEADTFPVSALYPEEQFMAHVQSDVLVRRDEFYRGEDGVSVHYVYYALPIEAWRI
jgi:hypothetical protein